MQRRRRAVVCAVMVLSCVAAMAQDAKQTVQQAVKTELAADAADHSRWLYYEVDRKPNLTAKQWVAETSNGDLKRVIEQDGRPLSEDAQRSGLEAYVHDPGAQAKQRRAGQHDDKQATEMLNLLPQAFLWTKAGTRGNETILDFKPDPQFSPPTWESRVFAAMAGETAVDNTQHRIVSLKGRLIHDVKFGYGLLGQLRAGGTFDVERREVGKGEWQITETHVHIAGRALIFKTISETEDDEKSKFSELPGNISLAEAESRLMQRNSLVAQNK
jgi:hypothetical protein